MDLIQMQIKNSWILCSLFMGFTLCFFEKGTRGIPAFVLGMIIPAVLLGWLYYFRMIGAGDIKLLCALGGIMGPKSSLECIWFSFLAGACISLAVLVFCNDSEERIAYLIRYLKDYAKTGMKKPYYTKGEAAENIHFSVPIFMSVMLYAGGIY